MASLNICEQPPVAESMRTECAWALHVCIKVHMLTSASAAALPSRNLACECANTFTSEFRVTL